MEKCANDIGWNFAKLKRLNTDVSQRHSVIQKQKHEEDMRSYRRSGYETFELWREESETQNRRRLKRALIGTHAREWKSYWREWCITHDIQEKDMPDCGPKAAKMKERMEEALDAWFNTKNDSDTFQDDVSNVHHVMARMDELVISSHNLFGIMMAKIETLENQLK